MSSLVTHNTHALAVIVFFALLGAFVAGCAKAPSSAPSESVTIEPEQEMLLGIKASDDVKRTERVSENKRFTALVNRVGQRLAEVAARPDYQWEFHVVASDTPNAFVLPGGKVFVYEGMFQFARTEAQLATVISHEIAHAIARHGAQRIHSYMTTTLGGNMTDLMMSGGDDVAFEAYQTLYGFGSNHTVGLPYGRLQESDADRIGLTLMAKAGYDPRLALSFWQNMLHIDKDQAPFYLSTHPIDQQRITELIQEMTEARKDYTPRARKTREYLPGAFNAPRTLPDSGFQPFR